MENPRTDGPIAHHDHHGPEHFTACVDAGLTGTAMNVNLRAHPLERVPFQLRRSHDEIAVRAPYGPDDPSQLVRESSRRFVDAHAIR